MPGINAATLEVPGSYPTIQAAINAAAPGDTINVAAGTYTENVDVNKSVNIIGAGAGTTTVNASDSGDQVFNITNINGVNISGFKIRDASNNYGIYLLNANNTEISDNNITNNSFGIYLSGYSGNNTISNNTISNNTDRGVFLWNSYENNITNNTANFNTFEGIYLYSSNQNYLSDNNASNNGRWGVYIYRSHYNTISNNTANSNTQHGLYIDESDNNIATNNILISNSQRGLYLAFALSNVISENTITGNTDHGVVIRLSENNTIYNNRFNNTANFDSVSSILNNSWNVTKQAGTNIIGGSYLGGNFWAYPNGTGFSETCIDADGDGICDSSYNLTSGNMDYFPLTYNVGDAVYIDYTQNRMTGTALTSAESVNSYSWTGILFLGLGLLALGAVYVIKITSELSGRD